MAKDTRTYPITVELPQSGRTATITRRGIVRDNKFAMRALGKDPDPTSLVCATLAQFVLLDGQKVPGEEFESLDMSDYVYLNEIITAAGDEVKNSPAEPSSQPLLNGASAPAK